MLQIYFLFVFTPNYPYIFEWFHFLIYPCIRFLIEESSYCRKTYFLILKLYLTNINASVKPFQNTQYLEIQSHAKRVFLCLYGRFITFIESIKHCSLQIVKENEPGGIRKCFNYGRKHKKEFLSIWSSSNMRPFF